MDRCLPVRRRSPQSVEVLEFEDAALTVDPAALKASHGVERVAGLLCAVPGDGHPLRPPVTLEALEGRPACWLQAAKDRDVVVLYQV